MKTFLKVVGLIILLAVAGFGALAWYATKQDSDRAAERAAVTITAQYDPKGCDPKSPISVTITNGSRRTVKSVDIQLEAYEEGHSDNLVDDGPTESTRVMKAGSKLHGCLPLPKTRRPSTLGVVFRASASPTFYAENEFVPPEPTDPPADTSGGSVAGRRQAK
jgi:hypothetical protein